jgi:hypothetical protein
MILIVLSKTRFKDYVPSVFVGGLVGVLAMVVWGSWMALLPLYTGAHVSSTTAISFLFIPVYAVPTGAIAALVSAPCIHHSDIYSGKERQNHPLEATRLHRAPQLKREANW